ncbi:BgTH12-03922 [Blumeria graminis f. sp. triticale]|uniref:BgTH12-03922 n=1 Tax=Blumeria graminis f. sp. triticale TaxID=1689686 RepID=A0A9W4D1X9_BLUGR|nr:BgTH12-03922 [Blumeria graminis f. sp. triticale]
MPRNTQLTLHAESTSASNVSWKSSQSGSIGSPTYPPPTARLPALPQLSRDLVSTANLGTKSPSFHRAEQTRSQQKTPSKALLVQALNHEHQSLTSDTGFRTDKNEPVAENFSRPRQHSVREQKELPSLPLAHPKNDHTTTLVPSHEDTDQRAQCRSRTRGFSFGSTHPTSSNSPLALRSANIRLSPSIPDYHSPDSIDNKNLNPSIMSSRVIKSSGRGDCNSTSEGIHSVRYDPTPLRNFIDGEEIRSSFRSVVTSNSSFLGTSGTERSSVLTKSSSRTSIFALDEGMSVDDAIGMYEGGFTDQTDVDDNDDAKLDATNSDKNDTSFGILLTDDLLILSHDNELSLRNPNSIFDAGGCETPRVSENEENNILTIDKPVELDDASSDVPKSTLIAVQLDETRDRYGFRKKTQHVTLEEYEAWNQSYTEYLARRKRKWITMMRQHNLSTTSPQDFPPKSHKVKRFVRKGIPPSWRGAAWFHYAGGPSMLVKNPGVYDDLVKRSLAGHVTETDDEIIERDLNRTFPDNIKFKPDPDPLVPIPQEEIPETPMLQSLRRVLRAFSIYHPKIGYCQSLNFLAGLLLLFMPEENAFWMLNIITRIFLPGTHSLTLEGANIDLGVLMTSVKEMMPSVWTKIGNELDGQPSISESNSMRLPPITLCTTAWFMSCFIGTLPIESTLRVWDSFFYEGSKTLFRIALTIFKLGEPQIKAVGDPMEIFQVVQAIPRGMIDCNRLMESCFKRRGGFVRLSQDDIERGRAERRRGYAEERDRIAQATNMATTKTPKSKPVVKKGNSFFSKGKKEKSDAALID